MADSDIDYTEGGTKDLSEAVNYPGPYGDCARRQALWRKLVKIGMEKTDKKPAIVLRDLIRKCYKSIVDKGVDGEFSVEEEDKFWDEHNQLIASKIAKEFIKRHGPEFSEKDLKFPLRDYWTTQRTNARRVRNGRSEREVTLNRARNIRVQKMKRRRDALDTIDWPAEKRQRVEEVLTHAYTSDDEDRANLGMIVTAPIIWESEELQEAKEELDEAAYNAMTPRQQARRQQVARGWGENERRRDIPCEAPAWTKNEDFADTPCDTCSKFAGLNLPNKCRADCPRPCPLPWKDDPKFDRFFDRK